MVYCDPVLYDQSETIVENFSVREDKRKFLIINAVPNETEPIHQFIKEIGNEREYELFEIDDEIQFEQLNNLLNIQQMGTQLYIYAKWEEAEKIFTAAVEAGFSEDEIQVLINGKRKKFVYCIKCYHLQEVSIEDTDVICDHCQISLEIGPFFSRERKGYIGYPYNPALSLIK